MAKPAETIQNVPLADITVDLAWNARSGQWTVGAQEFQDGSGASFEALKASIGECGVMDPVKIRPVKNGARPYALVSGFRRYAASFELGLRTIPAVVREMTETEARLENTRENAAREDLKPPDLAWAVAQLVDQGMTDTQIASAIARSQTYVSQLHRIMSDVVPGVTNAWRTGKVVISVDDMYALAKKCPKERQEEGFRRLAAGKIDDAGRVHKNARLQRLAESAHEFGRRLGRLVRMNYVAHVSDDFEDMVENVIKIPGKATARERRALADAMARGYAEATGRPMLARRRVGNSSA